MLPVAAGVFALFAALAQLGNEIPDWALWSVLAVYTFMTIAAWLDAGRSIGRLSNRLVEIEREINRLMKSTDEPLLKWETSEQERRGPIGKLTIGRPLPT